MNDSILLADRYIIEDPQRQRLGSGGMGDVYRGVDQATGQPVAVKRLRAALVRTIPQMLERFAREGEALRRLDHPNIVKVLDTLTRNDEQFIIMEYVAGGTLRRRMDEQGPLPLDDVLAIGLSLADALARAHHLNIIHRDIKPGNVLLADDGTALLSDFGLARIGDKSRITDPGALPGTYSYVAPEVYQGERVDTRSDIWSLGVVLFEMLTGRLPFVGSSMVTTMNAILTRPTPDIGQFRSDVPEALASLIYRLLAKRPEQRIGSARLVGAQLELLRGGVSPSRFDQPDDSPVLPPPVGPRHNLPAPGTPLVGRARDIDDLAALLTNPDCRLLTLVGPGGMGKTRLAIATGRRLVDAFTHGVRFVQLATVQHPDYLLSALADGLGLTFGEEQPPEAQLLAYLREKELLLVLDNLEHLLDGVDLVRRLLHAAPRCKILATSREALNLSEEWLRPVTGLAVPAPDAADAHTYPAVALFTERARRHRAGFDLEASLPAVVDICRLVAGMPLGIELAAGWLRTMTPEQIAVEIASGLDFLSSSMRDLPQRHRSMRAVFDYSWELLSEPERSQFTALSIFAGTFDLDGARTVTDAALATVRELINKSLLQEERRDEVPLRLTLHPLLGQYAAEKLAADPPRQTALARAHAAYYLQGVTDLTPRLKGGDDQRAAFDMLRQRMKNIHRAWDWAVLQAPDDPTVRELLHRAAPGLLIYFEGRGHVMEAIRLFDSAVEALDTPDAAADPAHTHALGRLLLCRGLMRYRANQHVLMTADVARSVAFLEACADQPALTADRRLAVQRDLAHARAFSSIAVVGKQGPEEALSRVHDAVAAARRLDDPWLLTRLVNLTLFFEQDPEKRMAALKETIHLAKASGDSMSRARALHNLSTLYGDPDRAEPLLHEALQLFQALDSPQGQAISYDSLGHVTQRRGDRLTAKTYLEKAGAIYADIGYTFRLAWTYGLLGRLEWQLGHSQRAEKYLDKSLTMQREAGDRVAYMQARLDIALFLLAHGDASSRVRRIFDESVTQLRQLTNPLQRAEVLDRTGQLALELGDFAAARAQFAEMAAIGTAQGRDDLVGWASYHLGRIALALGDCATARSHLREGLACHERIANSEGRIRCQGALGRVALVEGEAEAAQIAFHRALALADTYWDRLTLLTPLIDWSMLLKKTGEPAQALRYLETIAAHPLYGESFIAQRDRTRAEMLRESVREHLPADVVDAACVWAATHTTADVAAALAAWEPAPAADS